MDAATRFGTQIVGALPVLTQYLERLDLADTVDDVVPWEGEVPLGTLVEVLILNRLLNPKALFRIDDWAQKSSVAEYYDLDPGELNDDRLGRALERLAGHSDAIQAALVLRAIRTFKLDVSQVHYDITDVELFGAYELDLPEGQSPPTPLPAYGRTKSGRKNVKQVQLGLNVTGDGAVPLAHAPLDGNAAEATTHVENLRRLRKMLQGHKLLYIGDSKLDTPENLLAVAAGNGQFLCGGVFNQKLQAVFLKDRGKLQPIAYHPKSQDALPPEERDQYQAFERNELLRGKVDGRQVRVHYRMIFV